MSHPIDSGALEAHLDAVAQLARLGHKAAARALADDTSDALRHHLAHAMLGAVGNDLATLESHARAALALAPDESLCAQAMAMAHVLARRWGPAEHEARRAILLDDGPRTRRGLAQVFVAQGRHADAERELHDLLARGDDADARLLLARLEGLRGETFAAVADHARAWALAPHDGRAAQQGIELLREAGWPLGVIMLTRVARAAVSAPEARALLDVMALQAHRQLSGTALLAATGMRDDIVAGLVALAGSLPPGPRMRAGRELAASGCAAEALAVVDVALPLGTAAWTLAEQAYVRGLVHARDGRTGDALDAFEAAQGLHPEHWEATCEALHVALQRGDAASLERAGRALDGVPAPLRRRHAPLVFNEAAWLHALGRDAEAHACLDWLEASAGSPLAGAVRALRSALAARA